MQPQIYLAQTPTTAEARRHLRARALGLAEQLARISEGPCIALLGVNAGPDLVLLRPRSVIVALIHDAQGPIELLPSGIWIDRTTGNTLFDGQPLAQVRRVRAALAQQLDPLLGLGTITGALVVSPTLHPESHVALDIVDHRERIKLLGMDELAPLASMLQAGAHLDEAAMRGIIGMLGGRLWHNGERLLFEVGLAPYRLGHTTGVALTLLEGENVIGRRTTPLGREFRLTIEGDDTISADHAVLVCAADGQAIVRDTSTNGTLIRSPEGGELRIHHTEQLITPGSIICMGETRLRLERVP